ncbi:MAG: hypothetical protein LBS11_02015 [Oscillospiraceae bacterium]|nr:hypothetical protein [Oscillospiraceae bacterium]
MVLDEYASSIQKTGKEAYMNMVVSQSRYLSTANKVGELLQNPGMQQAKSLDIIEKALQRTVR